MLLQTKRGGPHDGVCVLGHGCSVEPAVACLVSIHPTPDLIRDESLPGGTLGCGCAPS